MFRFVSGFFLGYVVAKKPPDENDVKVFVSDMERFWDNLRKKIR